MATKLFRRNEPLRRPSLPDPTGAPTPTRRNSLPFLPRRSRRRALTPPFPDGGASSRQPKLIEQDRSLFMFDLPYELREQIYLEVLGDGPIWFEEVDERTGARKKTMKRVERWRSETGVISLMQSCRQAYIELHPLIYSTHTIHLPSLPSFRHLTSSILPPHHLTLLTTLHLHLYFPYILFPIRTLPAPGTFASKLVKQLQHFDLPAWLYTWDVLGDMVRKGGLTHLRTTWRARDYTNMHPDWPKRPDDTVAKLLWDPLVAMDTRDARGMRRLRVWEIEVTWPVGEDGDGGPPGVEVKDWPFGLRTVQVADVAEEEQEEEEEEDGEDGEGDGDEEDERDTDEGGSGGGGGGGRAGGRGSRGGNNNQRDPTVGAAAAFAGSSGHYSYFVPSS